MPTSSRIARALRAALIAGTMSMAGCGGAAEPAPAPAPAFFRPDEFSATAAMEEVRALVALGPRDAGSPGAEKAATHIQNRLTAAGVSAKIDAFADPTPAGDVTFRNVIGTIPGRGKGLIVLGSHYDTKSGIEGFVGANDSGSSTGVLLEMARVLARGPVVDPEIQLVFFDGEEAKIRYTSNDGLHGSRRHASRLVRESRAAGVLGVIVLDMIGDRNLNIAIPRNGSPELMTKVFDAARGEGVRSKFSLHPHQIGDDHEPFLLLGMPAIDLIDFQYGSAPELNEYWHTAQDTLDKLSEESLGIAGRVTIRVVNDLARPSGP
jgi:glutaminyl-peptide cyclotransferase